MKKLLFLLFCLNIITLVSCEDILECVINRRPELPEKSFENGDVGFIYYQEMTAEIKNEPNDDAYGYNFEIHGEFPDGIEMNIEHRSLFFEGVPQSQGVYDFTLFLNVDPPVNYNEETQQYENSMCSESTSKQYTIVVN